MTRKLSKKPCFHASFTLKPKVSLQDVSRLPRSRTTSGFLDASLGQQCRLQLNDFLFQRQCLPTTPDDDRRQDVTSFGQGRPLPIIFPALNLIVKHGLSITVAEGQCVWAIRHLLPNVPILEVCGWCRDQGETFIYMQLVDGITLEDAWPDMVVEEKYEICVQLHNIWGELRQLKKDSSYPFIGKNSHVLNLWAKFLTRLLGSVDGHHIRDIVFQTKYPGGTFSDIASFNEWFANLARPPVWTGRNILTHGAVGCWMMPQLSSPMPTCMAVIS